MITRHTLTKTGVATALGLAAPFAVAAPQAIAQPVAQPGFTVTQLAGAPSGGAVGPDDIAQVDGNVFVGYQNGVGTKGEPSTTGQTSSTVVEYNQSGSEIQRWNLTGKVDGLGGDPKTHQLIATVDEDGNTSLYTIRPRNNQVQHFTYSPEPDANTSGGVYTGGGTDAVTVQDGRILISASNPSAANGTAAFVAQLDRRTGVAHLSPTFADNATATDAVSGDGVTLRLTDPDSNATVPESSPRFGGQLALVSQADQEIIFARGLSWGGHGWGGDTAGGPQLTRLNLMYGGTTAGIDDVRWAAGNGGTLYVVDNQSNAVYAITGPFQAGQAFAGLDTVGPAANPTTNTTEVDTLDLSTGNLTPFATGFLAAKGLLWMPTGQQGGGDGDGGKGDHHDGSGDGQGGNGRSGKGDGQTGNSTGQYGNVRHGRRH
jgi:hypothetical protein